MSKTPRKNSSSQSLQDMLTNASQRFEKTNKFIPPRIHDGRGAPIARTETTDIEKTQDPRYLLGAVKNLMRTRHGSVLSRNTILKMDHFEKGVNTKLDFHLQGAPNFRMADLNVYGVAQPTVFNSRRTPKSVNTNNIYLNGYPYVLRDYADPLQNMVSFLGINANRLEKLEERLKADIVKEAKSMGGLLLVHQELADGTVVPCFIAADQVQTPRELFEGFKKQDYRLNYFRIPISPEQAPEDSYFDEYVRVLKTLEPTDPLIFNCGMGAVRTTVGIVIAQIIRRAQFLDRNAPDPFPVPGYNYSTTQINLPLEVYKGLEEVDSVANANHALLRLVYIMEQGLNSKMSPKSAIEWALSRGNIIESLKEAIMGNYQRIVALTAVLESGHFSKKMLDQVIDASDAVINLREDILMNRIKQTQESSSRVPILKASAGLQRYFSLVCFACYINESDDVNFNTSFSSWLTERAEIWTMLTSLRKKSPKLYLFRPVEDLHLTIQTNNYSASHDRKGYGPGMFDMMGPVGSIASELEDVILKSRTGVVLTSQTILKIDFWSTSHHQLDAQENNQLQKLPTPGSDITQEDEMSHRLQPHHVFLVQGAHNFRRIKHTHVYGVAQPTMDGLRTVIRKLITDSNSKIQWINLREEPIIYINGIPYVLRDRYFTLRNIKVYKGITGERLEQLEERLKQDVIREVTNYDGRILLHGEDKDGNVLAAWEEVNIHDVLTVREVMYSVAAEVTDEFDSDSDSTSISRNVLDYHRVPITAEKSPEWCDFDEIRCLISSTDLSKTALIMNCQVGLGRSTLGTIIATLITRWIKHDGSKPVDPYKKREYLNYQIINSLLRVIQNGLEIKRVVDHVIDKCGAFLNLRDMIESEHVKAEKEQDAAQKAAYVKRGVSALQRYFVLLCFQAYLDSTSPDESVQSTRTFEEWIKKRPEIGTLLLEFNDHDIELIIPVEKSIGDGVALSSEIMSVVASRHGQVLGQQTILKHDAFPGCQKMSLKEKIEGAYNFRRIPVQQVKDSVNDKTVVSGLEADLKRSDEEQRTLPAPFICGCAMPSKDAIEAVLKSMDAGPGGHRKVLWTCLREEPVLYVNKQPYVLRLFQDPLKNLESTGITTDRVESMEQRMKLDAIHEWKEYEGRLLLHDEKPNDKGEFETVGLWESIQDIETPKEVFQSMIDQGYQVDYLRIPITDEQAPILDVFDQLIQRTKAAGNGVDVLYNCQMGRGRTTTGMVTACLMTMIMNNSHIMDRRSSSISNVAPMVIKPMNSDVDYLKESYEKGEFKIILQLVSMLTFGKLAKRLTDKAIDMCDHMQNLRKAIYDYKLRLDAMEDQGSKQYRATKLAALNYLIRYFYLIVFANYLLEELVTVPPERIHRENSIVQDGTMDKVPTFKSWVNSRREITNILKLQPIELE
ncbi:hypothetical protein INT47_008488 [Mucor saturninus]|uniref:Paladin n=1 Tax=Mucor saturninus TaxID=64648 RepID=A0A8H7R9T9_9FUNG|nr:hypothetical protein INT47_008488 [Mucor saturninus]